MISAEYVQIMARYNAWQNTQIYSGADALSDAARREDRGAFFSSIHATLNHLLWADEIWMSRFADWVKPSVGIPESTSRYEVWADLRSARAEADARITDWAAGLTDMDLDGVLAWYSGALGADVIRPLWVCVTHFFNHQTHHRGQVHAMLTGAGGLSGDTDLFMMPEL